MKIRTRLLLSLFITAALAFWLVGRELRDDVKFRYFQILEDGLNETAALLATQVEQSSRGKATLSTALLRDIVAATLSRRVEAEIFGIRKSAVSLRVYVTDARGIVIYDSAGIAEGKDYSKWNDVYRTLHGSYGARSSRDDERFPGVSIKYIAAPIRLNGKIAGVITAAKPAITLEQVIAATKDKIAITLFMFFAAFLLIGIAVTYLITRPLDLLISYVKNLRSGAKPTLPKLGNSEIGTLGREFELMRSELDGRKYIESFVQMLTHEFKTPVAGILGATEILEQPLSDTDRKKFVGNISREAERIQAITENLLQIATLENARVLPNPELIDMAELLGQLVEDFAAQCAQKNMRLALTSASGLRLTGNYFLLYRALANLIQNALDFSPAGSEVELRAQMQDHHCVMEIKDHGTGIPAYAADKVFDKFYSLERPDTRRKGTGLGLAFVRLVAELHGGSVSLANRADGTGAVATMQIILAKAHPPH
ncbi:MAG: two-component system sensor histidine kinase CreC [Turneriella sp.]